MAKKGQSDEGKALALAKWLMNKAIDGLGPLCSAKDLAREYEIDQSYSNAYERACGLIRWETSKNFTTGFLTGLGGVITLPVAVPGALGASWLIQARMVAAIAALYGHDLKEDRVRTLVLLSLVGDSVKEVVKRAGIQIGRKSLQKAIMKVPGKMLIEINKKVGFRLLTKAGEKGVLNLIKVVPIAGGVFGGVVDASMCYGVGRTAIKIFGQDASSQKVTPKREGKGSSGSGKTKA